MKVNVLALVSIAALLVPVDAVSLARRVGLKLSQAQAESRLKAAGVKWDSSGNCSNKNNPKCTSFAGIIDNTINNAITLKEACNCDVTITGGTEVGHPSGTYSHANGYKLDFRKATGLNDYIHNHFTKIGNRGDGKPQWRAASGNVYCDEGSNWDVVFYIAV